MLKDAGITASGDRKTILKRADSFAKKQNVLQENGIHVQLSIECIPSTELISQD